MGLKTIKAFKVVCKRETSNSTESRFLAKYDEWLRGELLLPAGPVPRSSKGRPSKEFEESKCVPSSSSPAPLPPPPPPPSSSSPPLPPPLPPPTAPSPIQQSPRKELPNRMSGTCPRAWWNEETRVSPVPLSHQRSPSALSQYSRGYKETPVAPPIQSPFKIFRKEDQLCSSVAAEGSPAQRRPRSSSPPKRVERKWGSAPTPPGPSLRRQLTPAAATPALATVEDSLDNLNCGAIVKRTTVLATRLPSHRNNNSSRSSSRNKRLFKRVRDYSNAISPRRNPRSILHHHHHYHHRDSGA
ncbi:unnamed protein product [Euphydryas editha]|uniref:Uncharacterized protein n=1 Tax=Euphydryas editha TaxID=104508 RepID=A0AAU9VFH7_EUPED|nr:unnamed protein product [Euphydryas editha]